MKMQNQKEAKMRLFIASNQIILLGCITAILTFCCSQINFDKQSPPTIELVSPTNGAIFQDTSVLLKWTVTNGANRSFTFNVYIDSINHGSADWPFKAGGISSDSFALSGLAFNQNYFWCVCVKEKDNNDSTFSSVSFFTTAQRPFHIISPVCSSKVLLWQLESDRSTYYSVTNIIGTTTVNQYDQNNSPEYLSISNGKVESYANNVFTIGTVLCRNCDSLLCGRDSIWIVDDSCVVKVTHDTLNGPYVQLNWHRDERKYIPYNGNFPPDNWGPIRDDSIAQLKLLGKWALVYFAHDGIIHQWDTLNAIYSIEFRDSNAIHILHSDSLITKIETYNISGLQLNLWMSINLSGLKLACGDSLSPYPCTGSFHTSSNITDLKDTLFYSQCYQLSRTVTGQTMFYCSSEYSCGETEFKFLRIQ